MINSKKKLNRAREKIVALKKVLRSGRYQSEEIRDRFQAKLEALEGEVVEYETLRTEGMDAISLENLEDIMLLPIRYRIAKGMTMEQFAEMTGLPARMLFRYEKEGYANAVGENLTHILACLPVKVDFQVSEREGL